MKLYLDKTQGGCETRTEPTFKVGSPYSIIVQKTPLGYWDVFHQGAVEVAGTKDYTIHTRP